jgi:hypothetical protein
MKRHIWFKMMLFHSLLIKKKDAQNGAVLNDTMHLFLPVDAHKQGNKKIVPLHCLSPSLSQKPKNQQDPHPWPTTR